jgi:hypothetical protein
MTTTHHTTATVFAALASLGALLITTSAASAQPAPDIPGPGVTTPSPTVTVVHSGSPWWTFVLVAVAAIAATLLVIWLVSQIRHHTAVIKAPQGAR